MCDQFQKMEECQNFIEYLKKENIKIFIKDFNEDLKKKCYDCWKKEKKKKM